MRKRNVFVFSIFLKQGPNFVGYGRLLVKLDYKLGKLFSKLEVYVS